MIENQIYKRFCINKVIINIICPYQSYLYLICMNVCLISSEDESRQSQNKVLVFDRYLHNNCIDWTNRTTSWSIIKAVHFPIYAVLMFGGLMNEPINDLSLLNCTFLSRAISKTQTHTKTDNVVKNTGLCYMKIASCCHFRVQNVLEFICISLCCWPFMQINARCCKSWFNMQYDKVILSLNSFLPIIVPIGKTREKKNAALKEAINRQWNN